MSVTSASEAAMDKAFDELLAVRQQLADAFQRASELIPIVADAIPEEMTADLAEEPMEAILRQLLEAKEQATADRAQVARLVVLLTRLSVTARANSSGLNRLEAAGAHVAEELTAAQQRADNVVEGAPGAAADAGMRSP